MRRHVARCRCQDPHANGWSHRGTRPGPSRRRSTMARCSTPEMSLRRKDDWRARLLQLRCRSTRSRRLYRTTARTVRPTSRNSRSEWQVDGVPGCGELSTRDVNGGEIAAGRPVLDRPADVAKTSTHRSALSLSLGLRPGSRRPIRAARPTTTQALRAQGMRMSVA